MTIVRFGDLWPYAILVAVVLFVVLRFTRKPRVFEGAPLDLASPRYDAARDLVADLIAERFDAVVTRFNARLARRLDAAELRRGWDRLIAWAGEIHGVARTHGYRIGPHDVVEVIVTHEGGGENAIKVVFDVTGSVAGLWLKPAPHEPAT